MPRLDENEDSVDMIRHHDEHVEFDGEVHRNPQPTRLDNSPRSRQPNLVVVPLPKQRLPMAGADRDQVPTRR
jgi:hypothetical protein